jgi:hypothetical protein
VCKVDGEHGYTFVDTDVTRNGKGRSGCQVLRSESGDCYGRMLRFDREGNEGNEGRGSHTDTTLKPLWYLQVLGVREMIGWKG